MMEKDDEKNKAIKLKISYKPEDIREILFFLEKVNINRRTLFPGLDGFATSLKLKSAISWLTPFIKTTKNKI